MGSPRIATRVSFRALAYRPVAHIIAFKAVKPRLRRKTYARRIKSRAAPPIRHLTDNSHGTINAEQVKSAAKAGQAHVWSRGVARWFRLLPASFPPGRSPFPRSDITTVATAQAPPMGLSPIGTSAKHRYTGPFPPPEFTAHQIF